MFRKLKRSYLRLLADIRTARELEALQAARMRRLEAREAIARGEF